MSSDMPDTAAKLPIMRNSGKVATWLFIRNVVASVANALTAGANPVNKADPTMPVSPMTAASGTWVSMSSHMTIKAIVTARPIFCDDQRVAKENSDAEKEQSGHIKDANR